MGQLSKDMSSIKTSVKDIERRVTTIEGDLKKLEGTDRGLGKQESVDSMEFMFQKNTKPLQETLVEIREDIQEVDSKVEKVESGLKKVKPDATLITRAVKENTPDLEKLSQMMKNCAPDMEKIGQMLKNTLEVMNGDFRESMKPLQEALDEIDRKLEGAPIGVKPPDEDPNNYFCKGEGDILSNLYRINVTYKGVTYKSSEHGFQITRAIHVLGPDHPLIKRMEEEQSPYIVKTVLSKEIPYSASWNKKERSVMTEIIQAKVAQHPEVDRALKATGSKRIVHNVADKHWGTGGKRGNGKNLHGRILMSVRDSKEYAAEAEGEFENVSEDEPDDWSEVMPNYKHKFGNAASVIFGDSLTGPFKENQFDPRGTCKVQAFTSAQLLKEAKKCEPNENVKSVTCHVGINDVMTNYDEVKSDHSTDDLKHALVILHEKFPNAVIGYSEAIYRKEQTEVDNFNHEMEVFINRCDWKAKYIDHDVDKENFVTRQSDFKHVDESGTKQLVARIKDRLNLRKPGGHRSEQEEKEEREDHRSRYVQSQNRGGGGGGARGRGRGRGTIQVLDRSRSRNRDYGGNQRGGYGGYQNYQNQNYQNQNRGFQRY